MNERHFNTLRPRQNGRQFADDIFNCIFLNENVWIPIQISLKFPKGPIKNIPALVQIMAWRRPGDKPLSEPMMVNLPTHICVSRPQWVNTYSEHIAFSLFSGLYSNLDVYIFVFIFGKCRQDQCISYQQECSRLGNWFFLRCLWPG